MGRNLGPLNIKDTYEGLVQITSGSIITDGSGSDITYLNITASNADQAGTAGYASTAGIANTSGVANTINVANKSDNVSYQLVFVSGDGAQAVYKDSSNNIQYNPSTNALSMAGQIQPSSYQGGPITSTGTISGTAITASVGFNGDLEGNADTATSSSWADQAGTAGFATTAATASFLPSDTNLNINSIIANSASFVSASIGYLTAVTGSVTKIGDAYILLNTNDVNRYAGIQIEDSGSATPTNFTASLNWDSQTNDWFYEYTSSGDPDNFGIVMFGPEYNTKGSPTYNTANTILKGNGGHHILDSSITDDGTDVVVSANISASGFISASTYYGDGGNLSNITTTDNLQQVTDNGASTTNDLTLANVSASGYISASTYYGDGSNLDGITTDTGSLLTTASYSDPLLTFTKGDGSTFDVTISSDPFPYTGNASIDGNLSVNGVFALTGSTAISSSALGTGSLIDNLGQEGVGTTTAIEHVVYCTQTEYDGITPNDNTMYVISGSGDIVDDLIVSGSMIGQVSAITPASNTGSLDCSTGNYFTMTLGNAVDTRLEASNLQIGQTINLKLTNNATAAGTISFGPEFEFEGGTAFTATAATSAVDIITLVSFDGTSLQTVGVKNFS